MATDGEPLDWRWVAQCRVLGGTPTRELFQDAVDRGDRSVGLLVDVLSRRRFREGQPTDCAMLPVHALRVLGIVRATSAIPAVVNVIGDPVDPGLYGEEAAQAVARIGGACLAPVEKLLLDRERDTWVRVLASRSMLLAAVADRRQRRRVREAHVRVLLDPNERDRTFAAHVVADACLMASTSTWPAIETAFAAGRVDEEIIQPDAARQELEQRRQRPDRATKEAARSDLSEEYVPWEEQAQGMEPAERERTEAELAAAAQSDPVPPPEGEE